MDIVRILTAGSVDDGKSTLIGRLLYDSKQIFRDQLDAVEMASLSRGRKEIDLALLTDGLRAEREQGITIDVAYRYFSTPNRKFIIADTPGHIEYTRNMVTGASTCTHGILLIDARNGVLEQTKRHAYIMNMLGLQIIVCINKMDLVDWSEDVYSDIWFDFKDVADKLGIKDYVCIPICAKDGDNVVEKSSRMSWYEGKSLIETLEDITMDKEDKPFRMNVQCIIRPNQSYRGYAGRVAGGSLNVDDKLTVMSSGESSIVTSILKGDDSIEYAKEGDSISIELKDDISVDRGDTLVKEMSKISKDINSNVCIFTNDFNINKKYILKQETNETLCKIQKANYKVDINNLNNIEVDDIGKNDIVNMDIHTANDISYDYYKDNKKTGSFILIDTDTNNTVAAGVI